MPTPDKLRELPEVALPALASELREYLLWSTSQTGGHFGAGLGVVLGGIFLMPAITSLMASLFVDDVADHVEREHYPADHPGVALPVSPTCSAVNCRRGLVCSAAATEPASVTSSPSRIQVMPSASTTRV